MRFLQSDHSLFFSHVAWHVGENHHCGQRRQDIPHNWMEGTVAGRRQLTFIVNRESRKKLMYVRT